MARANVTFFLGIQTVPTTIEPTGTLLQCQIHYYDFGAGFVSLAVAWVRLPHGVRLAWEENACMVVIGTGASELDGVVEAR